MDKNNQQQQQLKIELTPEIAAGHYSNLAVISHSANEFFLDFIAIAPNMPQAKVQSRIIMTPENMKNLLKAIADNVNNYEKTFGAITHKQPVKPINNGGIPNPFEA